MPEQQPVIILTGTPSTGPGFEERFGHIFKNNLLVGTADYDRPLLNVWQKTVICGRLDTQQLREIDSNAYVRISDDNMTPLLFWSPLENEECRGYLNTLVDLRKLHPEFEANNYKGPLFKSLELANLQLITTFPGYKVEGNCPMKSTRLLVNPKIISELIFLKSRF